MTTATTNEFHTSDDTRLAACTRARDLGPTNVFTDDFGRSLFDKWMDYGKLSDKQWFWFCVKAGVIEGPARKQFAPDEKITDAFDTISGMFAAAREHLKYPKIRLRIDGDPEDIVLSPCGDMSKYPGAINVKYGWTEDEQYGTTRAWAGRINTDGTFRRGRECTDALLDAIKRFAADPEGMAKAYGDLTGNCCYCGRPLKDKRSTDVGYGKTCASRYQRPWG